MKENVRKYFMAGTDEEVQLGDVICQELVKDFKDGRKLTREVEFKVTEETLPYALEMGIIEAGGDEEAEEEQQDELLDFCDEPCEQLNDLIEDFECLEERVEALEKEVGKLGTKVLEEMKELIQTVNNAIKEEEKKPASPKKKK